MDAESHTRLRRNLDAATDDALVALANRGLVRRAAKDLEQADAITVEETEDGVLVHGDGWTVTMPPDGPASATDDTPATGVTRQVIAATMFLRDRWQVEAVGAGEEDDQVGDAPSDEAIKDAAQRLVDAPDNELFKWSGKTPLLEASATLESAGEPGISHSPQLTVEFSDPGVRVVLMTDRPAPTLRRLLDQFKTTASKSDHARWVMLAVLALKRAAGKDTTVENDPGAELTDAIRDDRLRIARRARKLLEAIAASGIAHPSSRIVERLRTAGVAAEAARFPRLARLLSSIADDAQLQIARDAAADPARMRQRMVIAHALADATACSENAERVDLFGRQRSTYSLAGDLELCGLGAYGWQTASGFEGLTVIFWDLNRRRFLTASVSRGQGQDQTFSIPQAYECGLGWRGGAAVHAMCRSQLTLRNAKTNVDGRLSVSETCQAVLGQPADASDIDFGDRLVSRWTDLTKIGQESQPIGLRLPDPRASYVVIQPAQWGDRWFDELAQAFVWQLHDESGAPLQVRIPWTEVNETSVVFLESLKVERDHATALLGRLQVDDGTMHVYPFSLFSSGTTKGDTILCPQFDQARIRSRHEGLLQRLRKKFKRTQVAETRIGDAVTNDLADTTTNDLVNVPPLFRSLILDVDNILSAALESGGSDLNPAAEQTLSASRDRLNSLGVTPLADALSAVLKHEDLGLPNLLRAAYRLHLFRQSLELSQLL